MNKTHKVVLFTEGAFEGDALVVMSCSEGDVSLKNMKYRKSGSSDPVEFDGGVWSYIVEKGSLCFHGAWNACRTGPHAVVNFDRWTTDTRIDAITFSNEGGSATSDCREKTLFEGQKPKIQEYFLTFYPTKNAFFISPAPLCELVNDRFRWVLNGDEVFTIDWDSDEVEYAYLEFFPHKESGESIDGRARPSPINVDKKLDAENNQLRIEKDKDSPDDWVSPLAQYVIQRGEKIKMVKNSANSFWEFNFCCKIGKRIFVVDPETKYGSGT